MRKRRFCVIVTLLVTGLSACGDDGERRTIAPTVTPTHAIASPPETPTRTAAATSTSSGTGTPGALLSATPTPTATATPIDAAGFAGVYDDSSPTPETRFGVPAVASLAAANEGVTLVIAFDGHTVVALTGTLNADGTVDLSGGGIVEDDEVVTVSGSARLSEEAGLQRIVGEFVDRGSFGFSHAFAFRRPVSGTPAVFARSYRFTFLPSPGGCDCTTTAVFTIEVGADGFGRSTTTAEERDVAGAVIGTFDSGECLVTAMGTVRCQLPYATTFPTPPSGIPESSAFTVTLTGRLVAAAGGATGSGRTEAAIFPTAFFLGGDWTAVAETAP